MKNEKYKFVFSNQEIVMTYIITNDVSNAGLSGEHTIYEEQEIFAYMLTKEIEAIYESQGLSRNHFEMVLNEEMNNLGFILNVIYNNELENSIKLFAYDYIKHLYYYRLSNYLILEVKPDVECTILEITAINEKDEREIY